VNTDHLQDAAEEIYLAVYGEAAENANYLQPRTGTDFLLPEALVVSLTTTVCLAFFKGFFGEIGKELATVVKKRFFNKGSLSELETPVLVQAMAMRIELIATTRDPEKIRRAQECIEQELRTLELAPELARRIAERSTELIVQGAADVSPH
jgi:hypothetical protein